MVLKSGVLVSTFNGAGKAHPKAHLDFPLSGNIDVFFHHVTNVLKAEKSHTLYLGLAIGNGSDHKVNVIIDEAVSYATKPDSPFTVLNAVLENDNGKIHSGPGDRVMLDMLRGHKQHGWDHSIHLNPGEIKMIYSLPLHVNSLLHPLNGRTGLIRMSTNGPVYLASLSAFAKSSLFKGESKPKLSDWTKILDDSPLVEPRDKVPTAPGAKGALIYGRVAGVAEGSRWTGTLANNAEKNRLTLKPEEMVSFPISTVTGGTLGTNQVQAAPMVMRYSDTAYEAHGNYGVDYDLTLPLFNGSDADLAVGVSFQTPLKDWNTKSSLQFFSDPPDHVFFRGTIEFAWTDEHAKSQRKLVHLVEKRGEAVQPLIELQLKPGELKDVRVRFLYPADCTPPQVLTITTRT